MPSSSYLKGLTWLGHASFRLQGGGVTLYFDPWRLTAELHDADLVLITHPHFDHLSAPDVLKVLKPDTVIVTVADCAAKLKEARISNTIQVVKPGDRLSVKGVPIEVVPAYNTNKPFHPRANGWVGFVVEVGGTRVYHAGDTDFIPEMKTLKVDVALLPVSGIYVMTAEEAAEAAKSIAAKICVPMHYGTLVGTVADAKRFQTLIGDRVVELLAKEDSSR